MMCWDLRFELMLFWSLKICDLAVGFGSRFEICPSLRSADGLSDAMPDSYGRQIGRRSHLSGFAIDDDICQDRNRHHRTSYVPHSPGLRPDQINQGF